MTDIKQVADAADMIVNGYAFTRCTEGYRVLNLNRPDRATVFSKEGDALDILDLMVPENQPQLKC